MRFVGGIYDFNKLNSIRHFSKAYFHGHSVGGTNPSLLEAMASECFILAHDNIFNRAVLKDNSLYYPNSEKVTEMLNDIENICTQHKKNFTDGNVEEIKMSILGSIWLTSMRNTSNGCWNRNDEPI